MGPKYAQFYSHLCSIIFEISKSGKHVSLYL